MIRIIHSNLGKAYHYHCDSTSAFTFFFKALNLCEGMEERIKILFDIGKIYLDQGDTKMTLRYFNDSLELISLRNQSVVNDNVLFWINYHISDVYKHENNLEKSIFFAKEALRLEFEKTNKDFQNIIFCYTQLLKLCPEEEKEYIEEILEIVQKHDLLFKSKILCHTIIGHYYKKKQKNSFNALYHFKLSLKYQLICIPPYYQDLINIYIHI